MLGPLIVDALADSGESSGASGAALYTTSFYLMTGFLIVGFVANELIRPVHSRFHEPAGAVAHAGADSGTAHSVAADGGAAAETEETGSDESGSENSTTGDSATGADPTGNGDAGHDDASDKQTT